MMEIKYYKNTVIAFYLLPQADILSFSAAQLPRADLVKSQFDELQFE